LDYIVQSETDAQELVITDPNPQLGFSGAPAVELTSGRTLGVLVNRAVPIARPFVSSLSSNPGV
jgi:hypothetical protein